jgi:uncharacterized protein (TIGR03067 family)
MKKSIIFTLLIYSLLLCFCSSEETAKKKKEPDINALKKRNVLTAPAAKIANPEQNLTGKWKAVRLGQVLKAMNYSLPSTLVLNKNNSFEYTVKIGSVLYEANGKYAISTDKTPWQIDLYQKYPREIKYEGIFDFFSKNTLRIIFYKSNEIPRPNAFKKENICVYIRQQS